MLIWVIRFFQRYALFFALGAGICARRWVLPDGGQWWLELGITLAAAGAVYFLLYKDGVTANRRGAEARVTMFDIIGFSVAYWFLILLALLLFLLITGDPATNWLPFGQGIDWRSTLVIAALVPAAVVYARGLRAAIRNRRRYPFAN